MSSSGVSEGVIQRGKLLVHVAENGHSFELNCDEYTLVESVQRYLESLSGIQLNDQLLLYLDMKLESQQPLSAYKLPLQDREVFLYNKSRMRSNSNPPQPEEFESLETINPDPPLPSISNYPHPLDEASDPALKALPSYERQFRSRCQLADAIYQRTLLNYETCERLSREQRVQEKALEIAKGNLDHIYKMMLHNYSDFVKRYSHQQRSPSNILVNFWRDLERLRSVKLMPALQSDNRKCLSDFVKEENLRKMVEDCSNSHRQFEGKVEDFKEEFKELKGRTEHLFSSEASINNKVLERTIKEHRQYINDQKSIMQALSSVNDNGDDSTTEFRECVHMLGKKVGILASHQVELIDRYKKAEAAQQQLTKELEKIKELVNTLYVKLQSEKQANKEKNIFLVV